MPRKTTGNKNVDMGPPAKQVKKKVDSRRATSGYVAPTGPSSKASEKASPEGLIKDLKKIDNAKKRSVGMLYRIFGK